MTKKYVWMLSTFVSATKLLTALAITRHLCISVPHSHYCWLHCHLLSAYTAKLLFTTCNHICFTVHRTLFDFHQLSVYANTGLYIRHIHSILDLWNNKCTDTITLIVSFALKPVYRVYKLKFQKDTRELKENEGRIYWCRKNGLCSL